MIKLISPLRLALYLLSKLNVNRLLKYELCTLSEENGNKIIKRNKFSAPIRFEDPLQPLHEALIIPIQNYDYRMLGNIIYNILNKSLNTGLIWEEPEEKRIKYSYHLLDYCYSLQKNLVNKDMYNWTNHKHLSHFIYIYLLVIRNNIHKSIEKDLMKSSLTNLIHLYYQQCREDYFSFEFTQHKIVLDEILKIGHDDQILALRGLLSKDESNYISYFKKGTLIANLKHPWEIA